MAEFSITQVQEEPEANKALVVFVHKIGVVLYYEAELCIREEIGVTNEQPFGLDSAPIDFETPKENGVYIMDLGLQDDGPGDWPGSREYILTLTNPVKITEEQWKKFSEDEILWK